MQGRGGTLSSIFSFLAFLLLLASILGIIFFVIPSIDEKDSRILEKETLKKEEIKLDKDIKNMEEIAAKIKSTGTAIDNLKKKIPNDINQDKLIRDMTKIAKDSGMEIKQIGFSKSGKDSKSKIKTLSIS